MGWLDWARPDLLPDTWHAGYGTAGAWIIPPEVTRDQKFGIIWHSAAGLWSPPGYTPQDLMRRRGNSWDGTIMTDGEVWKHRPRPTFVNWHGGGPAQNLLLGGWEVEGTGVWTPAQKRSILRVNVETHRYLGWPRARLGFRAPDRSSQDSIRGTIALVGKGGNFEHTWLSYTTCPGGRDQWAWLIAETNRQLSEEDDMPSLKEITDATVKALRPVIAAESKKAAVAALAATAKSVTEVRNSLRGGDLPGIWVKAKGQGTIYYVEYVGGVLMRHHARNPASYIGVGGNWKVIEVSPEQLELMPRGPGLPDLRT